MVRKIGSLEVESALGLLPITSIMSNNAGYRNSVAVGKPPPTSVESSDVLPSILADGEGAKIVDERDNVERVLSAGRQR